jgi:hypothetical protein
MWIYPPELLPLKLRSRGNAIAVVSQWLWTFLVVEITPPMITNIGYKSYIVFAVFNFVTVPIVYFTYPVSVLKTASAFRQLCGWFQGMRTDNVGQETCGLPLEAVDLLFADRDGKRPSIFRVARESRNKEYLASIKLTLQERAIEREEAKVELHGEKAETLALEGGPDTAKA